MLDRILSKLNFIKKLPRSVAKSILYAIIIFDEFFWKIRIFIFTKIFFGKRSKIGKALIDLKRTGVAIIPNFYPDKEVLKIKEECIKLLDELPFKELNTGQYITNLDLKNGLRVEKMNQEIKLKGIDKANLFFRKIGRDLKSNILTLIYQLTFSKPFLIYNIVQDGSFKHPVFSSSVVAEADKFRTLTKIAGKIHIDHGIHHLRCCIILDDIKKENGPTVVYENSMNKIKKNHLNILLELFKFKLDKKGEGQHLGEKEIKFLEENTNKIYITGNRGDFVMLDLKTVHYPHTLEKGQRHILWHYY